MKMGKKAARPATNFKNQAFLAPNRTIDESPAGSPELTQKHDLRDPLRAPGQNPRKRPPNVGGGLRPDETYGGTEIPDAGEHGGGDLEKKHIEPGSPRPNDPRQQHEKKGEKERHGLKREFGRE